MNIIQAVKEIASYLSNCFEKDKFYIKYKSSTNPEEFETKTPDIYIFTCPSSSLIDGLPSRCPSIVLTLDGRDDSTYDITANLCIASTSISEQEKARPNNDNTYTVGDGEGYDTDADNDLIIESVLFTEQICNYIYNFKQLDIGSINIEYPDVSVPDFPYAISSVSFKVSVNLEHRDQNPYNDLY